MPRWAIAAQNIKSVASSTDSASVCSQVPAEAIPGTAGAVTVRIELATPPEVGAADGLKLHVKPAGAEQENCTDPENPPVGSAVKVKFADWPIGIVALVGDADKLKSGGPDTGSTVIAPSNPCC